MLPEPNGLPVETARLLIRGMRTDDAAFILELLNEPDFLANIGDKKVRTMEDAVGYIQSAGWDNYERFGFGMNTVELADSSARIGICGLLRRDELPYPDLGFAFLGAFHGQGFATEAAGRMLAIAGSIHLLPGVSAITSHHNEASARVLRKLGLKEGEHVQLQQGNSTLRYFERSDLQTV